MDSITLGKGSVGIYTFYRQEVGYVERGIILTETEKPHPIGSRTNDLPDEYVPTSNDMTITCTNLMAARVLQDYVNKLVLEFQGFECKDGSESEAGDE